MLRQSQRRFAQPRMRSNICSDKNQDPCDLVVAAVGRFVQSGASFAVGYIRFCPGSRQHGNDLTVSSFHSFLESRCAASPFLRVQVDAGPHANPDLRDLTSSHSLKKICRNRTRNHAESLAGHEANNRRQKD